ncbi:hypothetical protein [Sporomusa sphaeroides]|nr:hypothetical protein [Sporomusa sphaeroides]HML33840.1 hypothetical protein [Sporomusa sphaeroides]
MFSMYVLDPFNFMLGFAWHREQEAIEVFIGLFAVRYEWGGCDG